MPRWHSLVAPGLSDTKRCFYVGETSVSIAERYREHKTGRTTDERAIVRPAAVFRRIRKEAGGESLRKERDVALRRSLMRNYEPQPDAEASRSLESSAVDELRSHGHCVYPRNVGRIPFKSYRTDRWD